MSLSKTAGSALLLATLAPVWMRWIAVAQGAPTGPAASPSAAELAGTWVAVASHDGETATIALHLEAGEGGQIRVKWSNPALHIWELPVGSAAVHGSDVQIAHLLRLAYDRAAHTLSGILPAALVPVYEMPVTFRRAALPRPPRPELTAAVAAPAWTFDAAAPVWADLAFADGVLYAAADDGHLYALGARTGKPLWTFLAGGAVRARPAIADGDVFVQADDGFLYRLSATSGKERWRVRLQPAVERLPSSKDGSRYDFRASAATLADGRLYVGTDDGHLLALNPADGSRIWTFPANGSVVSTPVVASGRVYFGSFDGHVYALDAASGALLWNHDTGAPVTSTPALHEDRVIIGSRSYDLQALDRESGKPFWTRYFWFSWVESSAAIFDGVAYIGSSDAAKLFAFDARSGRRLWELDAGGCPWGEPAVTNSRVFIGTVGTQNYLIAHRATILAVDRKTGLAAWRYPIAAPASPEVSEYGVAASPVLGDGLVYFAGLDGRVLAFRQ
ncbi:MAG TPA: PQQ-binding-like beta-propeller repeat protein [Thermoanaerobaculia bacterium]|jgi:outer membrane protein assembly factor BamB|nr:PQQ-binding-like beta-propeller repeat protein [Thermoanaerobaculia bacterium]